MSKVVTRQMTDEERQYYASLPRTCASMRQARELKRLHALKRARDVRKHNNANPTAKRNYQR